MTRLISASRMDEARPARVCHISTVHSADDSRVFWRECMGLASRGFQVVLMARSDAGGWLYGVHVVPLKTYSHRLVRMTFGVARAFRLALGARADVYHVHDPELVPLVLALRLLGKKVVYDAHEWFSKQVVSKSYLRPPVRLTARLVARGLEWAVNMFASRVVVVNDACAEIYRPRKVTIVANFPDHRDRFTNRAETVDGRLDLQTDTAGSAGARFIYVGGITRQRGVLSQVDAIGQLNRACSARLTLLGKFADDALYYEVTQLPGWAFVDYMGLVPHADVAMHMAGATAGLATLLATPNHLISSPVKVFEYMACGLPVILSDFPAWRSMLDDVNCAIFVDPHDPAAIAAAMQSLVSNPDTAARMGAAGRWAVDERFNWATQLDNLVDAYRRMGVVATQERVVT